MWERIMLCFALTVSGAVLGYVPHVKDHYMSDALLRDVVDRLGRELMLAGDGYVDPSEQRLGESNYMGMSNQVMKVLENLDNEESGYPVDIEGLDPPSLRDREFLQHSSLWGNQYIAGGSGEGRQHLKPDGSIPSQQQVKTDPTLPAYCNPPNPCPVGFTAADGCLEEFENTAAFSRKFQAAQECMCDTEHMFDCPVRDYDSNDLQDLDLMMPEMQDVDGRHKNLVAKKFHTKKASNPYLMGDKLPIAAKKGLKLTNE